MGSSHENFWVEYGCLPGMTPEETKNEIRKFEKAGYAIPELVFQEISPARPGPSADEIDAWERKRGIKLPGTLRDALQVQDGGYVRGTRFVISPLADITPLSTDNLNRIWESEVNQEFGDPSKLILIGRVDALGGSVVLDYNIGAMPRVIWLWSNLGNELRDESDGDFDQFIAELRNCGIDL